MAGCGAVVWVRFLDPQVRSLLCAPAVQAWFKSKEGVVWALWTRLFNKTPGGRGGGRTAELET